MEKRFGVLVVGVVVEVGWERKEWSVLRVCWMVVSDMVDFRYLFVVGGEEELAVLG